MSSRSFLHIFNSKSNNKIVLAIIVIVSILIFTFSTDQHYTPKLNNILGSSSPNVLKHLQTTNQVTNLIHDSKQQEILDYDRDNIKYIYPEVIDSIYNHTNLDSIDWTKYAYILYATSTNHMCNAMMIFAELRKYETKAQLVLLVNNNFIEKPWEFEYEYNTLISFSEKYNVKLKATSVKTINDQQDVNIWISSFTKLMVFNETDYDRVIYLDSDAILLNGNLDELFFIPPCKLASVTGYWLTDERYKKQQYLKYQPETYNFKPKTQIEKMEEINEFIKTHITPYQDYKNHLPINNNYTASKSEKFEINQRNFQNNLYNNLPNFKFLDEYSFTNIIMVIQPSSELFAKIEESFGKRKKNEFDMDIINFYIFKLIKSLELQKNRTKKTVSDINEYNQDIPEFLILPHQRYGVLTSELNVVTDHKSFLADPMDQPFINTETSKDNKPYYDLSFTDEQSKQFFPQIKYLHFSDLPIPKPWIEKKIEDGYMSQRLRCANHKDFIDNPNNKRTKPKGTTKDCTAGKYWEQTHQLFEKIRMDVCSLRLKWVDGNPYANDQN